MELNYDDPIEQALFSDDDKKAMSMVGKILVSVIARPDRNIRRMAFYLVRSVSFVSLPHIRGAVPRLELEAFSEANHLSGRISLAPAASRSSMDVLYRYVRDHYVTCPPEWVWKYSDADGVVGSFKFRHAGDMVGLVEKQNDYVVESSPYDGLVVRLNLVGGFYCAGMLYEFRDPYGTKRSLPDMDGRDSVMDVQIPLDQGS